MQNDERPDDWRDVVAPQRSSSPQRSPSPQRSSAPQPARTPPLRAPRAAAVRRSDAPFALLIGAVALSTVETSYAWAERWNHAPAYFLLSAGLTLALALAVGLVGAVVRASAGVALALWAGLCFGVSLGWIEGAAALAVALLATRTRAARSESPAVLGTIAALALAAAWLKDASFAEHLGHEDDPRWESCGAVLVLGVVFALVPLAAGAVRRAPAVARVAVLLALGCVCALRPRLERGDGEQRLPPAGYAQTQPRQPGNEHPDVFLVVLDTVRADHLSVYGYGRPTTPELDRLVQSRKNAAVFPRAYANGTWTVPSHASLFTGRLPRDHGAHFALDGSVRVSFGIADALPTLAERMQSAGYATLAGYANHWLRSVRGMGRGFDRYLRAPDKDELPFVGEALRRQLLPGLMWEAGKGCARASEVDATLLSLVEPWSAGPNPLFVFANFVDAHGPYAPPAPFRGTFAPSDLTERAEHLSLQQSSERHAQMMARYDEELAYLDHQLGELFRALDARGLLRTSWVFVTADHGEAFGEHGVFEHGTTVFDEVVHVPLIVFPPDGTKLQVTSDPVSLVDVAATIAGIGGVELADSPGRDLRLLEDGGARATALEFYGDPVKAATLGALAKQPARVVLVGRHKLIVLADSVQLFDIEKDPGEHVDLASALPNLVEHLRTFLPEFRPPTFHSDGPSPEGDDLERLRGLGYVQ